jgi:hypothetical protein
VDIYQFCETYRISVRKAKRMQADGVLALDVADRPLTREIRHYLGRSQPLTALMVAAVAGSEVTLKSLGNHQDKARKILKALDLTPAPAEVAASVDGAIRNEPEALAILGAWVNATVKSRSVVYHQELGARLLLGMPEVLREREARKLVGAMGRLRQSGHIEGLWRVVGKRTIYGNLGD